MKLNSEALRVSNRLVIVITGSLTVAAGLSGCGSPPPPDSSPTPVTIKKYSYTPISPAGLPITADTDTSKLKTLFVAARSKYGPARKDPFSLTKAETEFETSQVGAKAFNDLGWQMDYVPQPENDAVPYLEPQPYRRLSGVVVGDSVLAIIDMGDGGVGQIVRPGQRIPNTEWTVVSIDQEKAVLRREGNALPKEVTVRLETPRPGTPGYNTGNSTQGFPGMGPGGPGGPGGVPPGGPGFGKGGGGGLGGDG